MKALFENLHERNGRIVDLLGLGILLNAILIAAAASLHILFLNPGWSGFFQKTNWSLYPLFWLALGWLMHWTWHPYMSAWSELRTKGVLHYASDCVQVLNHRKDLRISDVDFDALLSALNDWRQIGFRWATFVGASLTLVDSLGVWRQFYRGKSDAGICSEPDFSIAALSSLHPLSGPANIVFDVGVYLMQGILIAVAFSCLFQVCIHLHWFSRIEKVSLRTTRKIELTLDPVDKFNQFGLAGWNEAVTWTYGLCALGMLIPLSSFYSQPKGCADTGQWLMRLLIPLLLFAPGAGPTWLRFTRVAKVRKLIDQCDESLADKEKKQRIWPFDPYMIGFALFCVNVIAYSLFLGFTASQISEWIKALK
jgi:hypothetical protein